MGKTVPSSAPMPDRPQPRTCHNNTNTIPSTVSPRELLKLMATTLSLPETASSLRDAVTQRKLIGVAREQITSVNLQEFSSPRKRHKLLSMVEPRRLSTPLLERMIPKQLLWV